MLAQFLGLWILLLPIAALAGSVFLLGRRHNQCLGAWDNIVGLLLLAVVALPFSPMAAAILYLLPSFCVVLLGVAAVAGPSLIIAHHWRDSLSRQGRIVRLLLVCLLVLPFAAAAADIYYTRIVVEPREYAQVKQDSAALIQTLTRFKNDTGRYPHDLSELTPNYLQVIPTIPGGYPYKYKQTQ